MKQMIENEYLKVEVSLLGGSLTSIFDKKRNEELIYQPEPDSWQGQDVCVFPFVARLKDKTYSYNGKEYSLRNHGLCRYYNFEVVDQKKESMTLLLQSNEETLKEYPFNFRFYASYILKGKSLSVCYRVENDNDVVLPFGIGAHPAFKLIPSFNKEEMNTSGNVIRFKKSLNLSRICFDEKGEMVTGEESFGVKKEIDLDKKLFIDYKTLCLSGNGLDEVTLERKDGYKIKFSYQNINYFVLWSFPNNGAFVAIEPWVSLPDFANAEKDILKKETLIQLAKRETYLFTYQLAIE